MRLQFLILSIIIFSIELFVSHFWPPILWMNIVLVPIFLIGIVDILQNKHGIRKNFPVIGNFRYLFEKVRPELQQYFVESDTNGRPIPREVRSVVYQRAKGQLQSKSFGTMNDLESPENEWINHSMNPKVVHMDDVRVQIGGPKCTRPYSASIFNVSAMSYGALSKNAVAALNIGASKGNFYHNTGEGGVSPYHLKGGDLVWQLGTGYFGCRNSEGRFCENSFKQKSNFPQVKMIEIKISQGAKPGKGGLLPGEKVNEEVANIRGVDVGKTVVSPPSHSSFSDPKGLLKFIEKLRELSGGKPIGIKLCIGRKSEFVSLCKAMVEMDSYPDYIAVDGAEGGTGAAPLEFLNSVGTPIVDGLAFVTDCLKGFGIKKHIKIIATGKVFTAFQILRMIALGADVCSSARGMMLSLGCIHALACNTNRCPTGVATTDPELTRGLHVPSKAERVARYHADTVHAFAELLGAMGYSSSEQIQRCDVQRRMTDAVISSYEEIFPTVIEGSMLSFHSTPEEFKSIVEKASAESFAS